MLAAVVQTTPPHVPLPRLLSHTPPHPTRSWLPFNTTSTEICEMTAASELPEAFLLVRGQGQVVVATAALQRAPLPAW